jgi:putative ABC transport system ATP-binding protein
MRSSVEVYGQTMVMVTHDAQAAAMADQVLLLADGRIVEALPRSTAHEIRTAVEQLEYR